MATNFPTGLDSYTTKVDGVDFPQASHINNPQDAIVAIQTKLGIDGSGASSSVDFKLERLITGVKVDGAAKVGIGGTAAADFDVYYNSRVRGTFDIRPGAGNDRWYFQALTSTNGTVAASVDDAFSVYRPIRFDATRIDMNLNGGSVIGSFTTTGLLFDGRTTSFSVRWPDWRQYNNSDGTLRFNNYTTDIAQLTAGGAFTTLNGTNFTSMDSSNVWLRLFRNGFADWRVQNEAGTGSLIFAESGSTRLTLAASGTAATFNGSVTASSFTGSGAGLTVLPAAAITGTVAITAGGTGAGSAQAAINALAGGVTANRVLRGNGTNVVLDQVNLATDTTGTLPADGLSASTPYDITEAFANSRKVGYRTLPRRTSGIAASECTATSTGITINTSDLFTERVFSIYNDSGSDITITQGTGVTLRWAAGSSGTCTLAARGFATFWCNSGTEVIGRGDLS